MTSKMKASRGLEERIRGGRGRGVKNKAVFAHALHELGVCKIDEII